ncbi:MAG: hypothetical protein ACFE9Z_17470, partial [Promethearchaeota archaeon]
FKADLIIFSTSNLSPAILYACNTSWSAPILLDVENINLDSIRIIYDYNYLLKPDYHNWYDSIFGTSVSYENIAYNLKGESDYNVVQYYHETFTVFTNISEYTHIFDIGDLSFENDFINLSICKVVGLSPTLNEEILTNNDDFIIILNKTTNKLTITDSNTNDGLLDVFDQITVILNFSYGPISSYTEIYLSSEFNQTYLSDSEETFYNYIDIDYQYTATTGVLLAESSGHICSDITSFKPISYSRNPDMVNEYNELIGYGSENFDNFEIYYDDTSILYVADIDMDGDPDYKLTIDVDNDGKIDIIKYGIDDPQGSGEIYWHTIIQDFENSQITIGNTLEEERRTEWFDIDDKIFAHFDFNIGKLLLYVLCLPLLPFYITKMMLPDVDYWAQKSTQNLIEKEEHTKNAYYSVKVDNDRDGLPDTQFDYQKTEIDIYYEITEYRKTILAAKTQNIFTFLGEYIARSFVSLFTGSYEDFVFNGELTEENLESKDFSTCNWYVRVNAPVLTATYRKFTENITTSWNDSFEYSTLAIIDFDESGDIEEQRIYTDDFDFYEIDQVEDFFSDLSAEHSITNVDTGQQSTVSFDPSLPFTHFENLTWKGKAWGLDNVPIKYDSLQVVGEDYQYTSNAFEKTIILRIPNRYSLYDDFGKTSRSQRENKGWVEFEVTGILIKPPKGRVYYTSDAEAFIKGKAKTRGYYFYVDSDANGFYETVYILSDKYLRPDSETGLMRYNVMSIGLNYDGLHDFAPYEKLNQKESTVSDLDNLAHESTMFGTDWIYNFGNLRNCELLWEQISPLEEMGLKPKDQIFEIYKLVETSEQNSKFSTLFYEVRHEAYSRAWAQYRTQLIGDIVEQVFMSVTAGILSAVVYTYVLCLTWWTFTDIWARIASTLTYFLTYTLMTKFSIDRKLHEAQAIDRSQTFYAISAQKKGPTSLNDKAIDDRILQDSMIAALIGHPGGYYTTVSGGESGDQYQADVLVSPQNYARISNAFGGFLELLWDNLWNMGESDPDRFWALDFDDLNLNFLLHTSELPSYNQRLYYRYVNTDSTFNIYNWYWANTLGYLETRVRGASDNELNAIRPTCIDGRPTYEFINREQYETVLPQQVLYRPIVLSEERYNELQPALGHMIITTQCKEYGNTKGIDPYNMMSIELQEGYKAKIPINSDSFYYPIHSISIDVVKEHKKFFYSYELSYLAQSIILNESYYILESGNLYFTKSIEDIISESYPELNDTLTQVWNQESFDSIVYYNIHVYFDVFIPDTTEETHNLALAQATMYTIMDYFNQYTYAETTANMISEIAYTETITFWSTLISAPLVFFGSWAVKGTEIFFASAGSSLTKMIIGLLMSPIEEVFEEIIKDALIEALCENLLSFIPWATDDMAFWLSTLATSGREAASSLGKLATGNMESNLEVSLVMAKSSGDIEIINQVNQEIQQKKAADLKKKQDTKTWQNVLSSNLFKGIIMLGPSLFFGPLSFPTLSSLKNILKGTIQLPKLYAKQKTIQQIRSKAEFANKINDIPSRLENNEMVDDTKKPAEIDKEALKDLYKELQRGSETDTITDLDAPLTINTAPIINPDPRIETNYITKKFKGIFSKFIKKMASFTTLDLEKGEIQSTEQHEDTKRIDSTSYETRATICNTEEALLS